MMRLAAATIVAGALLMTTGAAAQTPPAADVRQPAFANVGFNEVTRFGGGERRELIGNGFIIFARPESLVDPARPVQSQRHWHTVVVTARHVVDAVCRRGDKDVRLTLLPPPNSTVRELPPIEAPAGQQWCIDQQAALRATAGDVDIFAFETGFALPQRALISAYDIAKPPVEGALVSITGFAPVGSTANPLMPTFGRGRPGLQDETQTGSVVRAGNEVRLDRIYADGGHSGSPVFLPGTDQVVGVLVRRGATESCADALQRRRDALGAGSARSDPALAGSETEEASCDQDRSVEGGRDRDRNTAFMLPVMHNAWAYVNSSLYESKPRRPGEQPANDRSERIDAALDLYRAWLEAPDTSPNKDTLREEFLVALRRLVVVERLQLYAKANRSQINVTEMLRDFDIRRGWLNRANAQSPSR